MLQSKLEQLSAGKRLTYTCNDVENLGIAQGCRLFYGFGKQPVACQYGGFVAELCVDARHAATKHGTVNYVIVNKGCRMQ